MKVNLDGVEAWDAGPGILPPGEHNVVIESAGEKTSSGGHPQVEIEMRAVGGPHDGLKIRDWITVIPEAFGRIRQFLEAVGYQIPAGEFDMPVSQLEGCRALIIVREELYDGKPKSKVKAYEPTTDINSPPKVGVAAAAKDDSLPF